MLHIQKLLDNLSPLHIQETGIKPVLSNDRSVKIVVFDIYGTLLISDSGDIDRMSVTVDNFKKALEYAGVDENLWRSCGNDLLFEELMQNMIQTIKSEHEQRKSEGVSWPEVNILSIWQTVISGVTCSNKLREALKENAVEIAMAFELLSNQVYPMPHMKEVLENLSKAGYPLGIVSNAQFYTPAIMNYFITGELAMGENISGFDPGLIVFSYIKSIAKPDPQMFQRILEVSAQKYNAAPDEILFVGNDMHKDVWAAKNAGIKTALFAGDKRSLRLHKSKPEVQAIQPDFTITDLIQLMDILSLPKSTE